MIHYHLPVSRVIGMLLAVAALLVSCAKEDTIRTLVVGEQRFGEVIALGRTAGGTYEDLYYLVKGLKPHRQYEARISYLGSPAAAFRMTTLCASHGAGASRPRRHDQREASRELLDTEIISFSTTESSLIAHATLYSLDALSQVFVERFGEGALDEAAEIEDKSCFVRVEGEFGAPTWTVKGGPTWDKKHFNIIIEEKALGLVPTSVLPMVVYLVVGIGFILLFVFPKLRNFIVAASDHRARD